MPVSANANNESIDKDAQINDVALQSVPYDDPDINEFLKQAKVPTTDINEFLKQAKVPPTGILTQWQDLKSSENEKKTTCWWIETLMDRVWN